MADWRQALERAQLYGTAMRKRDVRDPAFEFDESKGEFTLTPRANAVVDRANKAGRFQVRPANTVEALDGEPIFGGGGGAVYGESPETAVVDPLRGSVRVVAHEAGHSVGESPLGRTWRRRAATEPTTPPLSVPRDSGQRMRYVHNSMATPDIAEEAHAQGFADGLMQSLGMKAPVEDNDWVDPLDYPGTFVERGLGTYEDHEMGPPTNEERKEARAILGGIRPFTQRLYGQGYSKGLSVGE